MRKLIALLVFGFLTSARAELPAVFDGVDDWQDAPSVGNFNDLEFSVCAEIEVPVGTGPSTTGRVIYAAASSTTSTAYVTLGFPDNMLVPEFTVRTSGSVFYRARGSDELNDGQRHTLWGTSDGTMLRLYVDGVERGSWSLAGATGAIRGLFTYGALRRGGTSIAYSSYWQGFIHNVITMNTAALPEQIAAGCPPEGGPEPPILEPCHGHTGLVWDPVAQADHYTVERAVTSVGSFSSAGDTKYKNRFAWTVDEEEVSDVLCPANTTCRKIVAQEWEVLRAWFMPVAGISYSYRVRTVDAEGLVSTNPSNVVVCGEQDPWTCYPPGACP